MCAEEVLVTPCSDRGDTQVAEKGGGGAITPHGRLYGFVECGLNFFQVGGPVDVSDVLSALDEDAGFPHGEVGGGG